MALLEELEETARLANIGGIESAPLGEGEVDALRRAFGARW